MFSILILDKSFDKRHLGLGEQNFNQDFTLYISDNLDHPFKSETYLAILKWLKDNDIWYHSVHRDIGSLYCEILYMETDAAMAFKLRWI